MGTVLRAELSRDNPYWISKHRYYELKHFCLQYQAWKRFCKSLSNYEVSSASFDRRHVRHSHSDPTAKRATLLVHYAKKMEVIENAARETDPELHEYILKGVTEELSYDHLKALMDIPCSKDTYYDRYRKFFWVLDKSRD